MVIDRVLCMKTLSSQAISLYDLVGCTLARYKPNPDSSPAQRDI